MYKYLKILIILTLGLVSMGSVAKPLNMSVLERDIVRAEQQNRQTGTRPAATPLTSRQQQIAKALDDVRSVTQGIWWNDFEEANRQFTDALQLKQTCTMDEDILDFLSHVTYQQQKGRPNYGQETKNIKFIYLTDASTHNSQSVVEEIVQVLQSVRRANPQARIALATEFAYVTNLETPIRFAQRPNKEVFMDTPYNQLAAQADKLGTDILALEDGVWASEGDTLARKIGNFWLLMNKDIHPAFVQNPWEATEEEFNALYGFLNVSSWGVKQRNLQWTRYIRAVQPFYDIIIAYMGYAHTEGAVESVPELVGEPFVQYNFYTLEEVPDYNRYLSAFGDLLLEAKGCVVPVQFSIPGYPAWDGKHMMTVMMDAAAIEAYGETLPEEKQQKILKQPEEPLEVFEKDVLVPDVTHKK